MAEFLHRNEKRLLGSIIAAINSNSSLHPSIVSKVSTVKDCRFIRLGSEGFYSINNVCSRFS